MTFAFPKIYPILDSSFIPSNGRAEFLRRLGGELASAGVTLLEYRNKTGADAELLADAEILRTVLPAGQVKLILDDRVDLVEQLGFDGVHVDAGDLNPAEARHFRRQQRTRCRDSGNCRRLLLHRPGLSYPDQEDIHAADRDGRCAHAARRGWTGPGAGSHWRHHAGHGC
jgi:hypothetical protein